MLKLIKNRISRSIIAYLQKFQSPNQDSSVIQVLVVYTWVLIGLFILSGVFLYALFGNLSSLIAFGGCSLIAGFSLSLLRTTKNMNAIGPLIIVAGTLGLIYSGVIGGGLHSVSLSWIALYPMMAGLFQNLNFLWIWSASGLIVLTLFALLHPSFPVSEASIYLTSDNIIAFNGLLLLMTSMLMSWLLIKTGIHAKQVAQDRQKRLTLALAELERHQLLIEEKLKENGTLTRTLCHDISNPLMVILATLEKVTGDSKDLTRLARATDTIHKIIEHVKDMAAVDDGKKSIELKPTRLKEMVDQAAFIYADALKNKNIQLVNVGKHQDWDTAFCVDPTSFSNSVLNNLISNAIKFSYENSKIEVGIRCDENFAYVSVRDYGVGIPEDIRNQIFSNSHPTSRLGTKGERGTGLGMPIMRSFLSRYGATVTVQSWTTLDHSSQTGTLFELKLKRWGASARQAS